MDADHLIGAIAAAVADYRQLVDRAQKAKSKLGPLAQMLSDIEPSNKRLEASVHLYCTFPEVPARELAWAGLRTRDPNRFVEAVRVVRGEPCPNCGHPLTFTRTTGKSCKSCAATRRSKQESAFETQRRSYDERMARLRTMPAEKYMATPHWVQRIQLLCAEAAGKHLDPPLSLPDICQICSAGGVGIYATASYHLSEAPLHLLCVDCADLLGSGGKISGPLPSPIDGQSGDTTDL